MKAGKNGITSAPSFTPSSQLTAKPTPMEEDPIPTPSVDIESNQYKEPSNPTRYLSLPSSPVTQETTLPSFASFTSPVQSSSPSSPTLSDVKADRKRTFSYSAPASPQQHNSFSFLQPISSTNTLITPTQKILPAPTPFNSQPSAQLTSFSCLLPPGKNKRLKTLHEEPNKSFSVIRDSMGWPILTPPATPGNISDSESCFSDSNSNSSTDISVFQSPTRKPESTNRTPVSIAPRVPILPALPRTSNAANTQTLLVAPFVLQSPDTNSQILVLSNNSTSCNPVLSSAPVLIAPRPLSTVMVPKPGERKRPFACDEVDCNKTYLKSSHLKAHRRTHTGNYHNQSLLLFQKFLYIFICDTYRKWFAMS